MTERARVEEEPTRPFDDPVIEMSLKGLVVEMGTVGVAGEGEGLHDERSASQKEREEAGREGVPRRPAAADATQKGLSVAVCLRGSDRRCPQVGVGLALAVCHGRSLVGVFTKRRAALTLSTSSTPSNSSTSSLVWSSRSVARDLAEPSCRARW